MSLIFGIGHLAWQRLRHERALTLVLVACIALPLFLPMAARVLFDAYGGDLVQRAQATPLIFGARGSRFDLVLGTLYLRDNHLAPVPWSEFETLAASGEGIAIPMRLGFSTRGRPLIGTTPEYYELRHLVPQDGSIPLMVGDCVLGADLAQRLDLSVGDTLFSDPAELYDIAKPAAFEMEVCGILARSGGPEDDAALVDVKTTWVLEGLLHSHADPLSEVDPSLILGQTEDGIVLNQALIDEQRVTLQNIASFHGHGDPGSLPLSSIIFVPHDHKAATLATTRVELAGKWRFVSAADVMDELLAIVLRLRSFLDRLALLLGISTTLLTALVFALSLRIRAGEFDSLARIGISHGAILGLVASEIVIILFCSVALALSAAELLRFLLPNLEALLGAF